MTFWNIFGICKKFGCWNRIYVNKRTGRRYPICAKHGLINLVRFLDWDETDLLKGAKP